MTKHIVSRTRLRHHLQGFTRPALSLALLVCATGALAFMFTAPRFLQADEAGVPQQQDGVVAPEQPLERIEAPDVVAFRQAVGGDITPLVIELKGEPGVMRKIAAEQEGRVLSVPEIGAYAVELHNQQTQFIASLAQRGVRALPRQENAVQVDGSVRHVDYRFTYLLNGFVAYVATEDLGRLQSLPEVAHISVAESPTYFLDKAVDYSLGTHTDPADRRTAVYGPTQEFSPATDVAGHPEAPRTVPVDGYEGQDINVAVIDSGVDWRHPMFGGTGHTTPLPRVSGQAESAGNNRKVIYYYALSSPGDPTDDFGHGTHVASTAAGYSVDGSTPPRPGFGTGRDGTGVGPTINGAQLFGTAPQARIMAYKVCGPANACAGDIPLAIEDAASPVTLVSSGSAGPTPVAKPVADVINLSLGSTAGDPAAANSRACNNAALAGTIVVTSAGNSGPGLGTVGNPGAATLAIAVAAGIDPGSTAVSDVLAPDQIPGETRAAAAGPPPERGAASNANAVQPGERTGMRLFPVAGGGPLPDASLSAHYVFVDRRGNPPPPVPGSATNRIALVKGVGTFAQIANPIAAANPAAILIITSVESATAVQVINGIPTYTISPADGNYLIDKMLTGDPGDGDENVDVPNGTVSELPLRLAERPTFETFQPGLATFSSRGPNDHPNANFRTVKPDVTAPGVGVVAAATIEGIPDETIGMASTTGYTSANGTSMASPLTAGAMALIRQRLRAMNYDTTDLGDPEYRTKRADVVTIARAMLQNTSTNLRTAFGVPQADGDTAAAINEVGSGHISVADALTADAIMVSPTILLRTPAEYNPTPTPSPAPSPATSPTPFPVMIPTASYGAIPVVRLNDTVVRTREVIIRDIAGGAGGGTYNLSVQNNRNASLSGFQVSIVGSADNETPITSVNVPAGGQASYWVRVAADGRQILADPTEFQWYVTATHAATSKKLRMPFYFRAVTALFPNSAAPVQQAPADTENPTPTPAPSPNCPEDNNGSFTVRWNYTGPENLKFRVQEATRTTSIFFDNADEPLAPTLSGISVFNENSRWRDAGISGTPQTPPMWTSEINPDTGSLAYFVPDAAGQNHSLTMKNAITLPPTGITLSFTTRGSLDNNFDFGFVEVSNDAINWFPVLSLTGNIAAGTRDIDLSGYSGQTVRLRFRMFSPTGASASPGSGWWVENIRISSDNFRTIGEPGPAETSFAVTDRPDGTYLYRVAAMYENPSAVDPGTIITGPYSNIRCVTVSGSGIPAYSAQLLNISTRVRVQTGDNVGIAGLISAGTSNKRVIFRAIGPSLTVDGAPLEGRLEDPVLELYDANGGFITSNDNWKETQQDEIEQSGLAPTHDREAAIARTLPPSAYTAIIRGKDDTTGIGVVEAYDRDANIDSKLANISTRGVVETGDNVLIGGFITGNDVGPIRVVVRAIGPSLASRGVQNPLQDPTIELYNQNGEIIGSNDDWGSSAQRAEIESRGLAPEDNRESAILQTVEPGNYTAIVRGKNDSRGVGLVEVYNVP